MKNKIGISILLACTMLVFHQCNPHIMKTNLNPKTGHIMETLNIKQLYKQEGGTTDSTAIKVKVTEHDFYYREENKITGEIIKIRGDKNSNRGFYKEVENINTPYQDFAGFYPNGNMRTKGRLYIGYMKTNYRGEPMRPIFSFPIGKTYFYDEHGNITKEIDRDKGFTITYDDLAEILSSKRDIDLNDQARSIYKKSHSALSSIYRFKNWEPHSGYWVVHYQKPDEWPRVIYVSAETGEILFENSVTIE